MITVWGRRNSMNVQKVMWTLGELNLEYQRHDVAGSFGTPDEYLALNPAGTVPTIQDGDLTMFESNACVRYLSRQYGSGSLTPENPADAAVADQWMDWHTNNLSPVFFWIFLNKIRLPAEQSNAAQMQRGIEQTGQIMQRLDKHLAEQSFMVGDQLTMADIPMGAVMYRYFEMDIDRPSVPNVERYYAQLKERDAYQYHVMIPFGRNAEEWNSEEQRNAGIQ